MLTRQKAVLVVEDDHGTRDLYRTALIAAGYSVAAVEDGLDALRRIEHDAPALVVLDLVLPRLGGYDVYREMQANPVTRDIPVIVVTGQDVHHLPSAQFHYFLRKPVSPDALLATVRSALTRSARSRHAESGF